jgi:DNA helicase II / ATP-dependent DNA helicase PcrA
MQYLSRFMEEYSPILTGQVLSGGTFVNLFFGSSLYALFRLGESEFGDAEDPFPKGRVPLLTIHQSKGLEFPVVVLGSVYRNEHEAHRIETAVRGLLGKEGEPLERIPKYDSMRLFYVGLSRAQNLLVLPRYTHAKAASPEFEEIFSEEHLPFIVYLDAASVPQAQPDTTELGNTYSYTGDYLLYERCPRNYMIYWQYGFVPSRGQTMFFGRLIHETIEDIHNLVLARKETADA